ncbi:MAG: acylneuraminate cytidylyltransferase family protein [Candidatus Omnitrophota bacterium]
MYKEKRILALIPARGGSKGLPRKNTRLLRGKPLIYWTIRQALSSKYLDQVIVSTDDNEIAMIAERYGASVPFLRPKRLATDKAKTIDVIFHALNYFQEINIKFDYLALLEPTSPLRKTDDIDKAVQALIDRESNFDSLVSLGKIALEHPVLAKKINKKGYVGSYIKNVKCASRRQDFPLSYFPYGVIYLSKITTLRKTKKFYQKRTLPYFIERWQNYEVDDALDFLCIDSIIRFKNTLLGNEYGNSLKKI